MNFTWYIMCVQSCKVSCFYKKSTQFSHFLWVCSSTITTTNLYYKQYMLILNGKLICLCWRVRDKSFVNIWLNHRLLFWFFKGQICWTDWRGICIVSHKQTITQATIVIYCFLLPLVITGMWGVGFRLKRTWQQSIT